MATQQELPLAAPVSSGALIINAPCVLRAEDEHRVVVVAGLPVHHYSVRDAVAEAYAMVFLVDAGYATQREVAAAFGCSERTLRRHQERYHDGGMAALATRSGWRPGRRRVPTKRLRIIEGLKAEGMSNREIARRMGVTEKAIRKEVGPSERCTQQQLLPLDTTENTGGTASAMSTVTPAAEPLEHTPPSPMGQALPLVSPEQKALPPASPDEAVSVKAEPVAMSLDSDPANRVWDRLLACCGLLDDAAPVFGNRKAVPGAAVLGAVPVLVANGVFRIAHKVYGEIGPAFYGLRTMLLTLLLMALWRVKRPEALKEYDPQTLGRVLGLDRAPESKTVRRKLTRLASYHKAEQLGAELARLRVEGRGRLLGFLYVDGHVRVYHGKRTIPKAHVARMRLSMPATTDYWVNDQAGDP
jgi:prepilin-type processing-associated H-X9-DG protein